MFFTRSDLHKENYLSNSQNQHVVGPELKLLHLSIKPIYLFNMLYYFQIEGNYNQELLFFSPCDHKEKYFSEIRLILEVVDFEVTG